MGFILIQVTRRVSTLFPPTGKIVQTPGHLATQTFPEVSHGLFLHVVQNNDWLTQLNLTILDNANPNTTSVNEVTDMQNNSILSSSVTFLDSLRLYFENYGDPTDFVRVSMISFSNNE